MENASGEQDRTNLDITNSRLPFFFDPRPRLPGLPDAEDDHEQGEASHKSDGQPQLEPTQQAAQKRRDTWTHTDRNKCILARAGQLGWQSRRPGLVHACMHACMHEDNGLG